MDIVHRYNPNRSRADQAVDALTQIMRDAESDRTLLLAYVLGGKRKFRNEVRKELGGMAITDDMLDKVWIWLFFRRGPDPKVEFEQLCQAAAERKYKAEAEAEAMEKLYDNARRRMD